MSRLAEIIEKFQEAQSELDELSSQQIEALNKVRDLGIKLVHERGKIRMLIAMLDIEYGKK